MVVTTFCSLQKLCLHKQYADVDLYDIYSNCGSLHVNMLNSTKHYGMEWNEKGKK